VNNWLKSSGLEFMYENAFNSIERELRNEDGIANELDYVEQISWVQFLKYLHDLETERRDRAELDEETYACCHPHM
jgi:type I restriction enzyme M protein